MGCYNGYSYSCRMKITEAMEQKTRAMSERDSRIVELEGRIVELEGRIATLDAALAEAAEGAASAKTAKLAVISDGEADAARMVAMVSTMRDEIGALRNGNQRLEAELTAVQPYQSV